MTMMRLSSLWQETLEQAPPSQAPPSIQDAFAKAAEKRKRIMYLAIPITIGLGLFVAVVYVGGRIIIAKRHAAPVAAASIDVQPPAVPSAKAEHVKPVTPVRKPTLPPRTNSGGNNQLTLITPRQGETYLQLAAIVPTTVSKYLNELQQADLQLCIAPGPTPDLVRVLVGPFPDADSLNRAKARLDAAKIVWLLRTY